MNDFSAKPSSCMVFKLKQARHENYLKYVTRSDKKFFPTITNAYKANIIID